MFAPFDDDGRKFKVAYVVMDANIKPLFNGWNSSIMFIHNF
jgi:hypothetical protein